MADEHEKDKSTGTRHHSRFRGRDGVTAEERDRPPVSPPASLEAERQARRDLPDQLPLFTHLPESPHDETIPTDLSPLTAHSSLPLARSWYRHALERSNRPANTIQSYCYDLTVLENLIGPKPLNKITGADIAKYLGEATSKTTRKRRLTSARRFFNYLINERKVLKFDPTEGYFPHSITLRLPVPLFANEQDALMEAARNDEPWSAVAIWLMMRLGITRSELLTLQRDHIDRTDPAGPVVYVFYDDLSKQSKERKLAADQEFSALYDAFLEQRNPTGVLFPVGRQAVNGMVDRVRRAAGITKDVTPNTLRHTYAVEAARTGADVQELLALLGLADDPRNRASVGRYIRLAEPALNAGHSENTEETE
ncbi:MAG TPA: tyrosine-type recombinase/integrase [Thermomicrobiales bacterium]|nr:tyrosine-type recombinase/integrase [Thermomicrobiales bacterium]